MSELIDRQALRAAHGLGSDCHDCKRDMKSCQYDRDYSLMDFCEWLDDAPTASPWHRVEDDSEFLSLIISDICSYSVENGMEPDDSLRTVAQNILELLEISTFNSWMPIEPPKEIMNE